MRVSSRDLFLHAYGKFGIGAFNVFAAEQVHGLFRGAQRAKAPILVQLTPAARRYMQPQMLSSMICGAQRIYPEVVFSIHLDHGTAPHCHDAIDSGDYASVMIDACEEPIEKNMDVTREIVSRAHAKGVAVEAELGVVAGKEDDISVSGDQARYTDPGQAEMFVEQTGCDSLAVAVGTLHGAYKHAAGEGLQLEVLAAIQKRLPAFPLVLHGASQVPHREVVRINAAGGALRESAGGIDDDQVKEAIKLGVCKINVATDFRLIWTRVHREFFKEEPDMFDPVVPGATYIEELAAFVTDRCRVFGSQGRASEIP